MCQPEHGHPAYGVPVLQTIRPRGLQTIPWTKTGPHGVEYKNPASDGAGLIYHNLIRAVQFLTQDIIWGPMQERRGGGGSGYHRAAVQAASVSSSSSSSSSSDSDADSDGLRIGCHRPSRRGPLDLRFQVRLIKAGIH
jgi:hypothetical protein